MSDQAAAAGQVWGVILRPLSGRPRSDEIASYALSDVEAVVGDDAVEVLEDQAHDTMKLFAVFGEAGGNLSYGPGKWSVKQILGHLADDERIFAYRALCIARNDPRELPGFDENQYALYAGFEGRTLVDLLGEYRAVREASLALFRGLPSAAWLRRGIVNGYSASVRGLAFHIAGHELHHLRVLREKYLPLLSGADAPCERTRW
jgi:hypothetical protein